MCGGAWSDKMCLAIGTFYINAWENYQCRLWTHLCPFLLAEINWDNNTDEKMQPGGRLNKKDGLTRYGDSHVKDKTS